MHRLFVVLAGLLLGAANPVFAQPAELKIGVLLPLTGPFGSYGVSAQSGLEWVKSRWAVVNLQGQPFRTVFVTADTQGAPAVYQVELQKLVERQRVALVLDPLAEFGLEGLINTAIPLYRAGCRMAPRATDSNVFCAPAWSAPPAARSEAIERRAANAVRRQSIPQGVKQEVDRFAATSGSTEWPPFAATVTVELAANVFQVLSGAPSLDPGALQRASLARGIAQVLDPLTPNPDPQGCDCNCSVQACKTKCPNRCK